MLPRPLSPHGALMTEPRRKQLRSFFCDEQLWTSYERRAKELGVTIDQLLGDALASALSSPDLVATAPPVALVVAAPNPALTTAPVQAVPAPQEPALPRLWVILDGKRYQVNKAQFIIGRGATETDLLIADTNVSRRHAQVVLHQGYFFIQDLGSTNGVRLDGNRVDTRRIDEGDNFEICEHVLTFTYRDLGAA